MLGFEIAGTSMISSRAHELVSGDVVVPVRLVVRVQGTRRTGPRMSEVVGVGRHCWRSHIVLFPF